MNARMLKSSLCALGLMVVGVRANASLEDAVRTRTIAEHRFEKSSGQLATKKIAARAQEQVDTSTSKSPDRVDKKPPTRLVASLTTVVGVRQTPVAVPTPRTVSSTGKAPTNR